MRNFYKILLIVIIVLTTYIHAEKTKELELDISAPRFTHVAGKITFSIKIKSLVVRPINIKIVYKIPEQLEYVDASVNGNLLVGGKNFHSFLEWKINIPAQTTRIIKVKMRGSQGAIKLANEFRFFYLKKEKLITRHIAIQSHSQFHISTYDTDDPCDVGKETIYVIAANNAGVNTLTNLKMVNNIPNEMYFLRAEAGIHKDNKKLKYRYDPIKRCIYFYPIKTLKPGEKITYKILCRAIKKGSAKNIAILKCDQFKKMFIDEEYTHVYDKQKPTK